MKIKRYQVIGCELSDLSAAVNVEIRGGWEPIGGVSVIRIVERNQEQLYAYQAMVLRKLRPSTSKV